jgi:hypothetical protein
MIDVTQLNEYIVTPTLNELGLYSDAARNLLLGTCAQESNMGKYIHQIDGPALGIYQMEPATHNDIWANYLRYRDALVDKIYLFAQEDIEAEQMIWNIKYATAMCRVHYLRVPHPLPDADDIEGLANYWKAHYNTHLGAGTIAQFYANYKEYVKL